MNFLPLIYEFLGTFLLILSIFASGNPIVVGLTLSLIICLAASVSGGFVNPAVSLAFYMKGALTIEEFIGYVVVQILGGVAAITTFQYIV